ncbi:Endosomal protein P24B [Taphrina deformans PYCC 5710]|uniref:Endosomal protein P24B n=1 Tax=Taphrina deformans (strain PYCC 5710 / ATCC 11124 / CBS 356.35 / IMI 108563 / JCM 9778 / NBRC 8474) TaxID=1097556 RepID=R4XBC4_TAPDE|nr:Endosomal protein P24B [Taphrina deformans PYCC 5710]|eukprot:CCG82900.1 Endosomal protein P24B [Taphrina deformans PYCC 5710]
MKTFSVVLSLFLSLSSLIQPITSHSITIPPHARECFHEQLHKEDRMTVNFQTDVGGNQQINFWLTDPSNGIIHQNPHTSMGDYSFEAMMDGKYTYCFLNQGDDGENREVSFNVHGVVYVSEDDPEHQDPLDKEIKELSELVAQVKDEQEYIVIRERVHRDTSESTNSRVKWWSIGQTVLLVAVCLFQVIYLKRFFEVKVSL